jgi:hypothetical protein
VKVLARNLAIVLAVGGAAAVIGHWVGRSASVGLYVAAALLVLAALSRGALAVGAYGEHATAERIRENNASRATLLFGGIMLLLAGVLVEWLGG